jgi:hypothetical protein
VAGGANCTEGDLRSYDQERVETYKEGAIQAISNTVPTAKPPTEVSEALLDEMKKAAAEKMIEAEREKLEEERDKAQHQTPP